MFNIFNLQLQLIIHTEKMYVGHSWQHEDMADFLFSNFTSPTHPEAEALPTPEMFVDSDKKDINVINNGPNNAGGTGAPTTIGFHMETMGMTFLMVLGLCLIAGLIYAYQKIKSLKKKLKLLKEDLHLATNNGRDRRRRINSN